MGKVKTSVFIDRDMAQVLAKPRLENVSELVQRLLEQEAERTTQVMVYIFDMADGCKPLTVSKPAYATAEQMYGEILYANRNQTARTVCEAKYTVKIEEIRAGNVNEKQTRFLFTTKTPKLL